MKKLENLQNTHIRENEPQLNAFGTFYEKYLGKLVPRYAVISLLFCLIYNCFVFYSTKIILSFVLPLPNRINMEISLDKYIPLSDPWILIYILAYVFWGLNFILAAREDKEHWYRCFISHFFGLTVCFIVFLAVPSTMARPELSGEGVFPFLTKLIYLLDEPTDLFPSIHCLASWYCFVWIRDSKKIHISYKIFSFVFALMVCASTMLVKQHCFVDFIAGIAVAEIAYIVARKADFYKIPLKFFDRINTAVFMKK